MVTLTQPQQDALTAGAKIRSRMEQIVERGINTPFDSKYPHTYLFSLPGYGKTHTVISLLEKSKKEYLTVSGATSIFAFGVQLAVINHLTQKNENIIISVDDCDGILKNEENCNIMKNVLGGHRLFTYEKSLQSQIAQLSPLQQEAIEAHQNPNRMGFAVPTDRFKFIFTSNFPLPTSEEVQHLREKGGNQAMLQVHRHAIRDRVKYSDIHLTNEEQWGLVTDILLNQVELNHINCEVKQSIVDFTWNNWSQMTERSIRTIEKMMDTVLESPEDFVSCWEIDYLR